MESLSVIAIVMLMLNNVRAVLTIRRQGRLIDELDNLVQEGLSQQLKATLERLKRKEVTK